MPAILRSFRHRASGQPSLLLAALTLAACRDDQSVAPTATDVPIAVRSAIAADAPGASATVNVTVPASMRSAPFNTARTLVVPPGFSAAVYARVPGARFMLALSNGDLLVSNPGAGTVYLVRPRGSADPTVTAWASGLYRPHDLVLHTVGAQPYVYVAEGDRITRYAYTAGDSVGQGKETIITGLPSARSPELGGSYGHELKNIALEGDNLYVSVASISNADPADVTAAFPRAAIHLYSASGSYRSVFARGIRNAEGLAILPASSTLWAVVNNRDNIPYPFHNDFTGDGTDDYGKVLTAYVDNHPPEEFIRVTSGANFGWPYCNPNPDNGLDDMPFDRDVGTNADGTRLDCAAATRVHKGIQAHSAPLGMLFFQGTTAPLAYRDGAAVALHGSWNRSQPTGYKIAWFPWDLASSRPGPQVDLFIGWLVGGSAWGRPVDVAVDAAGGILVSDDASGTIYRFTYNESPPPVAPSVSGFTLINADTDLPISAFDPLVDGAVLEFSKLPTRRLNIRANTSPATVGSVRFGLNGNSAYFTDNTAPYALAGGTNTDYAPWTPTVGGYTLTATAFSGADAGGTGSSVRTVNFTVVEKRKGRR